MPFIERLHSRDGKSRYLTRVHLLPARLLGGAGLYLHIFHRGDEDADPHDHPWDWWTMPLVRGYLEDSYDRHAAGRMFAVSPWCWHKRAAEHVHRVLKPLGGDWSRPLITLVWHKRKRRDWGFWVPQPATGIADWLANPVDVARYFVPWRDYIAGRRGGTMPPPPDPDFAEVDEEPPPPGFNLLAYNWRSDTWLYRNHAEAWCTCPPPHAAPQPAPVPMILHCPSCHARHVDAADRPPHKTHACQACGLLWRPALVPTAGVRFLPGCVDATAEAARAGDPDAIAALPAAAAAHLKAAADRERLLDERHSLSHAYTGDSWADGMVRDRIAEIDRRLGSDLPPTSTWFSNDQVSERIRETAKELQARIDDAMQLVAQEEARREQRRVLAAVEETKGVAAE